MILGALSDAGGQKYLATQAQKNPVAFMSLLGRILPTTANVNVSGEPTTEELIAIILGDPELVAAIGARADATEKAIH